MRLPGGGSPHTFTGRHRLPSALSPGGRGEPTRPRPAGTSAEGVAGPGRRGQHGAAGKEERRAMPPRAGPSAARMTAPHCCTAAAPSSRASPPRSPSPPRRRETRPAAPHGSARHGTPPPPRVPAARLPRQPRREAPRRRPAHLRGCARRGGRGASPARRSARRPPRPRAPRPAGKVSLPRPSTEEPPGTRTVPAKSLKATVGAGSRVAEMRGAERAADLSLCLRSAPAAPSLGGSGPIVRRRPGKEAPAPGRHRGPPPSPTAGAAPGRQSLREAQEDGGSKPPPDRPLPRLPQGPGRRRRPAAKGLSGAASRRPRGEGGEGRPAGGTRWATAVNPRGRAAAGESD